MKSPTVEWTEKERGNACYVDRNGAGKCRGVEVYHTKGHFVSLQPITSKGNVSQNSIIQIPEQFINKVCSLMQEDLIDLILTNLKDQLPRLIGLDPTLDELVAAKLKK